MHTIECIRFRSCQPIGRKLAKHLFDSFSTKARSQGLLMTVWLDSELSGDLCVHLEQKHSHGGEDHYSPIGLSIEKELDIHGLVTRHLLVSASEKD